MCVYIYILKRRKCFRGRAAALSLIVKNLWPWLLKSLFAFLWYHFILIFHLTLSVLPAFIVILFYFYCFYEWTLSSPLHEYRYSFRCLILSFFSRWAMSLPTLIWGSPGCLPACSQLPPENREFPLSCLLSLTSPPVHYELHSGTPQI